MKATHTFDRIIDYLAYIAGAFVIFIMLSISAEVVSRHLLDRPIAWAIQFSEYSLLYIVFLGAPWLLRRDGHPTLDILVNILTERSRALLNMAMSFVGATICFFVASASTVTTYRLFLTGARDPAIIEIPKGPLVVIIPIGACLLFIQFLRRAFFHLRLWEKAKHSEKIKIEKHN